MDAGGDSAERPAQGWFVDPFGEHDTRWFSQGAPTALVRDGRHELQDPPPGPTWTGRLLPARIAPAPGDDPLRAGDQRPTSGPDVEVELLGTPARPDRVGAPVTAGQNMTGGPSSDIPGGRIPVTPQRIVGYRWVALGVAVAWTLLVATVILSATTTTPAPGGHARTTTEYANDPAGVALFVLFLLVCCGATGIGLFRRVRAGSEAAGRGGYVVAGSLFVLGVLSLASIGLTLIVLASALFVVARPIKRPRPLPGERLR